MTPERMTAIMGELVETSLKRVLGDWEVQIGLEARAELVQCELVRSLDAWRPAWNEDWSTLMHTRIEGNCEGPIHFVFPHAFVWEVLREALGWPKDKDREAGQPLKGPEMEAYQEMMNLLCGSFNTVLSGLRNSLRVSQAVEHLRVDQVAPRGEGDVAPPSHGLGVALRVAKEGKTFEILALMPVPLARSVALSVP